MTSNGIFGFAYSAGRFADGYVYRVGGAGFADLFDFKQTNGWAPYATPTLSGNTLYGVTFQGGTNGSGNIFRIDTDGLNFTNLYDFSLAGGANVDGLQPYDLTGLVLSGDTLYGTTTYGGSGAQGTVFTISTAGTGFTVLHSFQFTDGGDPYTLILSGGALYGAALTGIQGISLGDGSIFKIVLTPTLQTAVAGAKLVLTWNDPAYSLYHAPTLTSIFTPISGATSPYTNSLTGPQEYFELK